MDVFKVWHNHLSMKIYQNSIFWNYLNLWKVLDANICIEWENILLFQLILDAMQTKNSKDPCTQLCIRCVMNMLIIGGGVTQIIYMYIYTYTHTNIIIHTYMCICISAIWFYYRVLFPVIFFTLNMTSYMKNEFISNVLRNLSNFSRDFANNSNRLVLILLTLSIMCDPNLDS